MSSSSHNKCLSMLRWSDPSTKRKYVVANLLAKKRELLSKHKEERKQFDRQVQSKKPQRPKGNKLNSQVDDSDKIESLQQTISIQKHKIDGLQDAITEKQVPLDLALADADAKRTHLQRLRGEMKKERGSKFFKEVDPCLKPGEAAISALFDHDFYLAGYGGTSRKVRCVHAKGIF